MTSAAIEDRTPREDEPAQDGDGGEHRGNRVTEKRGSSDGASEGGEVRCDVVDRGDKSLVHDVGDGNEETAREGALNDVTTGSNGSCGGSYLCTAGSGYDGPTGLGTPIGTSAL